MKVVRGRIEHWYEIGTMIFGCIYDSNPPERFPDGVGIHTSGLVTKPPYKEGQIVETRNSKYLLGVPAKIDKDNNNVY